MNLSKFNLFLHSIHTTYVLKLGIYVCNTYRSRDDIIEKIWANKKIENIDSEGKDGSSHCLASDQRDSDSNNNGNDSEISDQ